MKVYRGSRWQSLTDSFGPAEYLDDWKAGRGIHLDGTIDDSGTKQTNLRLEIEDPDVVALFEALVERGNYPPEFAALGAKLTAKLTESDARVRWLEAWLRDIRLLISEDYYRMQVGPGTTYDANLVTDYIRWLDGDGEEPTCHSITPKRREELRAIARKLLAERTQKIRGAVESGLGDTVEKSQ
ncbi:MAG: hypothetical protein WAL85_03370 [Candidatus Korobacteraceae bacterium]